MYHEDWRDIIRNGIHTGDSNAVVNLIEFADFECPACKFYHESVVPRIRSKFGPKVSIVHVHFPLQGHKFAMSAAIAAECAFLQGRFEQFADAVYSQQDSIGLKSWGQFALAAGVDTTALVRCVTNPPLMPRIETGLALASKMQLHATPTIFINGWRFPTPPPADEVIRVVEAILSDHDPFPGRRSADEVRGG
ncbi:partial Disulfide bond formation protein D, partial [Planctomycetaceae bacterium]